MRQFFFQGLGENTCLLQPALKSTASAFNLLINWSYNLVEKKAISTTSIGLVFLNFTFALNLE